MYCKPNPIKVLPLIELLTVYCVYILDQIDQWRVLNWLYYTTTVIRYEVGVENYESVQKKIPTLSLQLCKHIFSSIHMHNSSHYGVLYTRYMLKSVSYT